MRIQLLEHDPEDFSSTNISFWASEKGYQVSHTYLCNNEKLPSLDSFDWLMIMGGSQHAWDERGNSWLREEKAFLNKAMTANKIIVGVCFGAQLLAEALGGRLFTNRHKEIGWHVVSLNTEGRKSFLFQNLPQSFATFHWHSDHFSLPPGCTALANSKATENQAFVCNDRPLIGFQFHPEYTRDMVRYYAREHSQEWLSDQFVFDKYEVLTRTDELPDTYWLMETLLNNIERKFTADSLIRRCVNKV
ncbi:type 1 glutamine amidotransferase [Desulfococcaceae bacterium HSG9]|nr:type 1 glutamine amidotransferase [Desulfococcaceae bacterium HSG9]